MGKRVVAVAGLVAGVCLAAASPAWAQTYPPPVNTITVDDLTPAPGQTVTVTMQTCKRGTLALFGLDLLLLGASTAGRDGVAQTTITVPSFTTPGRHTVVGVCIGANLRPLVLQTQVTVTPAAPGGAGGGGQGGAAFPPPSGGDPGTGSPAPAPGGAAPVGRSSRRTGALPAMPSTDALATGAVPADAATLFDQAAAATGVTDPVPARSATGGGSSAEDDAGPTVGDSDPGTMSIIARVSLGLAALGGVPAALALSRRRRPTTRRQFA